MVKSWGVVVMEGIHLKSCPVGACFYGFRNRAAVSLFWAFWAPQRLPSDQKIWRKLPFGHKHHLMGFSFSTIHEDDCSKEEFQDEPI